MPAASKTLSAQATREREVIYNVKKRPVRFVKRDGRIVVECTYDTMGRRATKKVTTNGTLTEHRRFLYRGYLQIDSPPPRRRLTPSGQSRFAHCPTGLTADGRLACCDLLRPSSPVLWAILWDSTQPTATRPLAIQKNRTWYTYGRDLTKNICDTYRTDGRIDNTYAYTPYGEVTPAHADTQPLRWSSEYHDPELGLVYYNYRHYNPSSGRWTGRDIVRSISGNSPYHFLKNAVAILTDYLGAIATSDIGYSHNSSLFDNLNNIDNQTYSADPQEGYNVCQRYTQSSATTCIQGSKCEMDTYPQKAKIACDGFISMYTHKGKLRNAVLCVAECLTEAENTNKNIECCNARNTARLLSHVSCYMKCGFVMDFVTKDKWMIIERQNYFVLFVDTYGNNEHF